MPEADDQHWRRTAKINNANLPRWRRAGALRSSLPSG
jgi:hypothetical protein